MGKVAEAAVAKAELAHKQITKLSNDPTQLRPAFDTAKADTKARFDAPRVKLDDPGKDVSKFGAFPVRPAAGTPDR